MNCFIFFQIMSLSKYYTVVLAGFKPYDELWSNSESRIWVSMADKDIKQMVEVAIDQIRDSTTPKNILIIFFQKVIGGLPLETIKSYMDEIVEEAQGQRWNKVAFSTAWFVPSHQKVWGTVGIFNRMAHRANEKLKVNRVNLHRALMTPVSPGSYYLRLKGAMWGDYQLGLALGSHLSFEGVAKLVQQVVMVLDTAFNINKKKESSGETDKVVPPKLDVTPGWNKNVFMRQIMADRGFIPREKRKRGERRLKMSNQNMPGFEGWHVYKTHGPLSRFNEREGILESMRLLLRRADPIPVWGEVEETIINEDAHVEEAEMIGDDMVELEITVVNDDSEPYDPEKEWIAIEIANNQAHSKEEVDDVERQVKILAIEEEEGGDDVVMESETVIEPEKEKGVAIEKCAAVSDEEKEKEEERKYNQDDNDDGVVNEGDVEWLLRRLKNTERRLKVEKEKTKILKGRVDSKDVQLAREKASGKVWKQQNEEKDVKIEELERELQRVNESRRFERNAYKAKQAKK